MNFTKENYKTVMQLIKPYIINFHTPGNGIILRHDVDDDLEKSFRCALIENDLGIKSTYFILNTAKYWKNLERTMELCRAMQGMGHEIGWHNNAITEHLQTGKSVFDCINQPIKALRDAGLTILLTAGHGDPQCYIDRYLNYNVFGFTYHGDWNGYTGPVFKLSDFGLVQDAIHDKYDHQLSDSRGKWSADPEKTLAQYEQERKRYQMLLHPQWWAL